MLMRQIKNEFASEVSLDASPNLAMFPIICWICSIGSHSNKDFVLDHCFGLAVLAWLCSRLSSTALLHYLECTRSSLYPLYRAGVLVASFSRKTTKQNLSFSVADPSLLHTASCFFPRVNSDLQLSSSAVLGSGALPSTHLKKAL